MAATREQIVAEARTWLKTRFQHQARIKGKAVDCLNLVIGVAMELQLADNFDWDSYPEYHGYGRSPNAPLLLSGCDRFLIPTRFSDLLPGDIIIFRFVTEAQHFAIVTTTDPLYIIHSYAQMRMVVEHRVDDIWRSRVVACYRFKNIVE